MFHIIHTKHQKGQSLVIIALAFLGLVAVAALVIDGGILYLNRRNAQTAADAAALAGARELCVEKGSDTDIENIVDQFALTENGATAVEDVTIDRTNDSVAVQTRLETSSFFARVLGYENNTAHAQASAGCFNPGETDRLLPIAWTCQPPPGSTAAEACQVHSIPWPIFQTLTTAVNFMGAGTNSDMLLDVGDKVTWQSYHDGIGGKMPYLVMDSNDFDYLSCLPPIGAGTIDCDFNDDGAIDIEGGADRGWLLLDGNGAHDLVDLMLNGYPDPITLPQWFPGQTGVATNVFIQARANIIGEVSLVPVFNGVCEDTTVDALPTDCSTSYEAGDLIRSGSGSSTYYRIAGFAPFVITCVSKGHSEHCPAKRYAGIDDNIKTIEGYFIDGYVGGLAPGGGFDLGVYIISLTP